MSPTKLNGLASPQKGLVNVDEPVIRAMVEQAFGVLDEVVQREFRFQIATLPPVQALVPLEIDERIVAQSGRFTLHARPNAIEGLETAALYVRKFIIPASAKPELRNMLKERLGVRSWNLFPDLQALAQGLKETEFMGD
jgi:hypothetical protein